MFVGDLPGELELQKSICHMVKFRLIHERENCIGCGACAAIAPDSWTMGQDGKADLAGGEKTADGAYEKEISDANAETFRQAATTCPVNVIHLEKDGKREI